ncbi:MAG: hypothetical protein ACYC77_11855 [Coriobacteriia bacterium]
MTLDEFASMTRDVIARDGFDDYLPTVCLPERRHIAVIEGIPADVDTEVAVLEWCGSNAAGEECLAAFKVDALNFKVIRRIGDLVESAICPGHLTSASLVSPCAPRDA